MIENEDRSSKVAPTCVLLIVAVCVLGGLTFLHLRLPLPFVMADEFIYEQLARFGWQPGSILGKFPNHLYFRIFRQTAACGEGFLACGRFINALFYVASLLPLYRTARLFASRRLAIVVSTLAIIGPAHAYTALFMPEPVYFFLFWCLSWFVLGCLGRNPWGLGIGTGILCGLLTLIKPHGLFVLGTIAVFYAMLAVFRRGRYSLAWLAKTLGATGVLFFVVRFGLGYLLAGREGFGLAGQGQYNSYVSSISRLASILPLWPELARILSSHVGALALLFPIPLALGLYQLRSLPRPAAQPSPRADASELSLFMLLLLGALVILVTKFTVENEQLYVMELDRLHGRYYDFVFPLLLIMVGAFLHGGERLPRSAVRVLLAILLSATAVGLIFLLRTLYVGFIDHPYLAWAQRCPRFLALLVLLGVLLQAGFLFKPRRAAWVFLLGFFPVAVAVADAYIGMRVLVPREGDVYEKAARSARELLHPTRLGQGIVVGQDASSLFRSLFQLDSQTTKMRILPEGAPIEAGSLDADRTWALIIGEHKLKIPYAARVSLKGASLVAFRPGLLQVTNSGSSDGPIRLTFDSDAVPQMGFYAFDGHCMWSRTASPAIGLPFKVRGSLRIVLSAYGYGPNANRTVQLSLGSGTAALVLPASPGEIETRMFVDTPAQELKVTGLQPASPADVEGSPDIRSLGICLRSLSIQTEGEENRDALIVADGRGRAGFLAQPDESVSCPCSTPSARSSPALPWVFSLFPLAARRLPAHRAPGGLEPDTTGSSSDGTEPEGGASGEAASAGRSSGGKAGSASSGKVGSGGAAGSAGNVRPSLPSNKVMTCDTPVRAVSTQHIEAECAFGPSKGKCNGIAGGQQGTQLENGDANVSYFEGGDYLYYAGVELDGIDTLRVHYAKGVDGGKVEVRLESATGQLIGTWTPTVTNSWATWSDATVPLTPTSGVHTVYLAAAGTTAGIANIDWLEFSAGGANAGPSPKFHVSALGFDTQGPKHAVIEGPAGLKKFYVMGSDGTAAWCGDLGGQSFDAWGSSQTFYSVDFTELTRPGSYRLQVEGSASSKFEIADHRLFDKSLSAVLGYFRNSRADDPDVWAADASVPLNGSSQRLDVRGGWYDAAGDISKYLTHLSYANFMNPQQIPLVAWALAWVHDQGAAFLSSTDAAAAQAEALWGADFLLRMLDPTGFFYTTVFDHWSGNLGSREVCAFDGEYGGSTDKYQSALREGGGMSIAALAVAARWKMDGAFTSAQYLAGAEKAFAHLNSNGQQYCDDGKENIIDDYAGLLAASELYATNHSKDVLEAARARAQSLLGRLGDDGCFIADGASRPFWHASDAGLPAVALIRYLQVETDAARTPAVKVALRKHLDYQLKVTSAVPNPFGYARQTTAPSRTGFFIPHENESGYWWQGENARLGSLASAALLGADAIGATGAQYLDLLRFAGWQIDWILGANPYDICFLQGFGDKNPPAYCSAKPQTGTQPGGIANGITGKEKDGSGIQWTSDSCGNDWRWVEQWIPHAAWYLVAVTALAR